jgi:hypothetical protein
MCPLAKSKDRSVQKIDGNYLYQMGSNPSIIELQHL